MKAEKLYTKTLFVKISGYSRIHQGSSEQIGNDYCLGLYQ
jgi:hypothetical protein